MQRTPSTPTKIANTPTKTASMPTKTASTPTKTASTPNIDLRGFVARQFFVANLRTFLVYNLQFTIYWINYVLQGGTQEEEKWGFGGAISSNLLKHDLGRRRRYLDKCVIEVVASSAH